MDYTREPIVETVITAKDGYRLAVRNSKNPTQEEFLVEALEVVSFGTNCFFRNLERPRAFMVPASDYEVLEIRETRVSLKAASLEGAVRTPPRETQKSSQREGERREIPPPPPLKEAVVPYAEIEEVSSEGETSDAAPQATPAPEARPDRRRERRRGQRRRRGGRDEGEGEETRGATAKTEAPKASLPPVAEPAAPLAEVPLAVESVKETPPAVPVIPTVIPPPTTLIRDDLERLRRNKQYEGAFYIREPEGAAAESDDDDAPVVPLRLQGDEESRGQEESLPRPHEENIYKATPAPLEDEDSHLAWEGRGEDKSSSETERPSSES